MAPSSGETQRDDHERDRVDRREPLRGAALGDAGAGHLHEVDRKHGDHDRRLDRRGRPVVHRPGAELRAAQAHPVEQRWSWHSGEDRGGRMTQATFPARRSPIADPSPPPGLRHSNQGVPMLSPIALALVGSLALQGARPDPQAAAATASADSTSVRQWREDLAYLARELPRRHKNLFHTMRREQFDSALGRARPQAADPRAAPGDRRAGADRRAGGRRTHQRRPHPGPQDRVPHLSGEALLLQGRALHPERRRDAGRSGRRQGGPDRAAHDRRRPTRPCGS